MISETFGQQKRIISALVVREMTTRYGRQGLGFAWIIGEPLLFCFGVMILWTATKPAYEHGIRLAPFVMTGYMSLILMRHFIALLSSALQANLGLMYHRQIAPLHLFYSRALLELGGATGAFMVVYAVLLMLGQVSLPHNYLLLYSGWLLLAWTALGFALTLSGLVMRYELLERLVPLISYVMIPVSGAFYMVAWIPASARHIVHWIPFIHGIEMVRAGVFGEFVPTYYDAPYALFIGAIMNILGLLIISTSRDRVEVE
ncbi:ABC transporter permease [Brevundimonas sp. NIBR11]|uniref:ABC transporter permease n=1 Tax=Brevundimonas sp. NIBR11 TaxID=3015999 RepID=UPI0022F0D3BE|nr:ABC transporter permease [Brevundimonas sp. NIBR11]WGM32269.1 Polysialic acid transport protein KpsM [Brevundimonas sp. NIBR11]